jgi:ribonuclease VapC
MIVIDSSALVAILQNEPERAQFASLIARANRKFVSAVTLLEAGMIARSRRGEAGLAALSEIIADAEIEIVPFDAPLAQFALQAFAKYGKGFHAQARLNLGDCASYALAKGMNAPLLYKGTDFTNTDIASASV